MPDDTPALHRRGILLVLAAVAAWSTAGLFVRLDTRRPVPIPEALRSALA